MTESNDNLRVTLGAGLILAVLAVAPQTAQFYLAAVSAHREADLKAEALWEAWRASQEIWGAQISELEAVRGEKEWKEFLSVLPPLSPALEEIAAQTAERFGLDLESTKLNMRMAKFFNQSQPTKPAADAEVQALDERIKVIKDNPVVNLDFHMSLAQSTDEARSLAAAKRSDLRDATWFVVLSGLLHLAVFVAGIYVLMNKRANGSKAASASSYGSTAIQD